MTKNKKIIDSRGTRYLHDLPVTLALHPLSKPFIYIGLVLSTILIVAIRNEMIDPDSEIAIVMAYSCFYLLTIGILSSLKTQNPPHKIFTLIVRIVCAFMLLCFIATLLSVFTIFTTPTISHFFSNSNFTAIVVVFFLLNIPILIRMWMNGFKRMVLEIEDSFHE